MSLVFLTYASKLYSQFTENPYWSIRPSKYIHLKCNVCYEVIEVKALLIDVQASQAGLGRFRQVSISSK